MKPKASLFVSTYESPRALELVCENLLRQSFRDVEVFMCDDGSGIETKSIVENFIKRADFTAFHIWQENQGFRKCKILNSALRKSKGDVFIFLDGDCIPHKDYIKDHVEFQEEGFYLAGRRVELGPRLTMWLTPEKIKKGFLDRPRLKFFLSQLKGDCGFAHRTIRVKSPWVRNKLRMNRIIDMKGCNYSVSRKVMETINGFDEEYEGYGREDTDAEIRFQNLGLKIKSIKGLAVQFHLWHDRRDFTPKNDSRLNELKSNKTYRCKKGWVKE